MFIPGVIYPPMMKYVLAMRTLFLINQLFELYSPLFTISRRNSLSAFLPFIEFCNADLNIIGPSMRFWISHHKWRFGMFE